MLADHEDEIICDFAQYYHVMEWQALPIQTAAVLACGLPSESRVMKALKNQQVDLDTMLLAAIADNTALLIWQKTKDAQHHRNMPRSYRKLLMEKPKIRSERSFRTSEEFEITRQRIIEGTK